MAFLKICRICLRTDIELRELNYNLSDFYEELCDYATDNTALLSCSPCETMLKKCNNFKKQCRKADKILRNWKKNKSEEKVELNEIYHQLPSLKHSTRKKYNKAIENIETVEVKIEDSFETKIEQHNYNSVHQNDNDVENIDNQSYNDVEQHNDDYDYNGDHQNDDDDDRALSEFISVIKAEKEHENKSLLKVEVIGVDTDEPKTKRKRARKPLSKQEEYETVFDIQLFHTEAEVLLEFEQRKTLERYITAQYKCEICFTVYKCQKLLDFHMRWHDPSAGDFACNVCNMRFKKYLSVRKHKNDVHFGLYKCKRCPLVTYHKMVMMHHFQKHQGVEFKCKHCNGVYRHSSTYMTHLRTRHKTEHVCVTCARTFVSDVGLMVHRKKVHKTTSKFDSNGLATCSDCNITFSTHAVYIVHVLTTPKHKDLANTIIGCPECGAQFDNKLLVRAHRRKFHPAYNYSAMKHAEKNLLNGRDEDDRIFECTMCGKSGTHNTWLYRHYRAEHPSVPYEQVYNEKRKHLCDECGKSFFTITALREHKHIHTGAKPYSCDKCPAKFRRKTSLKMHLERHLPPTRECQHCGKKFVSASNLSNHMRTTSKFDSNGLATCSDCNITFSTHAVYIVHVLTTPKHKDLANTIIGCPECGAQFDNKLLVRAHRRKFHPAYNYSAMKHAEKNLLNGRDEDDRIFECTMCGKSGTHNTWLYRHYRAEHPSVPYEQVYNEKRKHLCDECGKSFFTITALREHKHIHTGAKPYSCDKCPAKFRRKTSLKMHLERHLPPTRECQHCGKKFVSASNLSNHMRSHIGDRRYKCEICSKGFLHSAALKEHIRGVHDHIRRPRKNAIKCLE